MTEFYNITTDLKNALINSPFVNTVTTGGLEDVDLNKKTIFPLSHIIVNSAVPKSQTVSFNVSVIAMDIVDESKETTTNIFVGNDNEQDVLNTQLQVLLRLSKEMTNGQLFGELIQVIGEPTCEPFTDRFENKLAGWTMTFDVEIPNEMTICGSTIPSTNCLDAFIQNSDGSFSSYLASGSNTTLDDINLATYNTREVLIDEIITPSNKDFQYIIPDTNLRNSTGNFNFDVPSCETSVLLDTQIVLKDTAGNVISTNDFPSCESYDLEAPDATVKNSSDTFIQAIVSNGTFTLADDVYNINLNGVLQTTTTLPSQENNTININL